MRITGIETISVGNRWKNWTFALVHTDEGLTGLGEGTLNGFGRTVEAAIAELRPLLVGEDPRRITFLTRRMQRDLYSDGGQIHRAAQAAIEVACWDILGQSLGVPIWQLLGGKVRSRVRAYANGWYQCPRTPDEFAARAADVVARGFTALKVDPFGTAWRVPYRGDLELALDLVAAVRDAVGPTVEIMIEGHSRFTPAEAIQIAGRLAPYRPTWFEEPVRHDRVGAVAEVIHASPVPIASGESFHNLGEFVELASRAPLAFWQPETTHLGGIGQAMQVAALAEAFDAVLAPHQAGGPVATAVCLHLAAALPHHYIQEFFDAFNDPVTRDLVSWRPELALDGTLPVPEGPGLGLTLDMAAAAAVPFAEGAFLPLFADGWERRAGAQTLPSEA